MAVAGFFQFACMPRDARLNLTTKIAFLSSLSHICFRKKSKNRW